jgi:hypothetical protein
MMGHMLNTSRCNIWGDPGIGKTSATLAALDILWLVGSNFHPALVIAPLRVARDVWAQEAQKWDELHHLKVVKILGAAKERKQALKQKGDVYVINYENIQWLVDTLKERWFFKIIVADESTRLKNFRLRHGGKRAAALARIAKAKGKDVNDLTVIMLDRDRHAAAIQLPRRDPAPLQQGPGLADPDRDTLSACVGPVDGRERRTHPARRESACTSTLLEGCRPAAISRTCCCTLKPRNSSSAL